MWIDIDLIRFILMKPKCFDEYLSSKFYIKLGTANRLTRYFNVHPDQQCIGTTLDIRVTREAYPIPETLQAPTASRMQEFLIPSINAQFFQPVKVHK